jgi:hypothetical protein
VLVLAGYLGGCLITLYLFLGLYYWALMTIAYDCRGSEYMRTSPPGPCLLGYAGALVGMPERRLPLA